MDIDLLKLMRYKVMYRNGMSWCAPDSVGALDAEVNALTNVELLSLLSGAINDFSRHKEKWNE